MPHQRSEPDACPGVRSPHSAADGALARVRLPGGRLTAAQMQVLADAATALGNGELELTSRGNIQLRAVDDTDELARRLAGAGLLPSTTHERIRNVVASPLTGRVGGLADLRPLTHALDAALQAHSRLADLPGRILFTLDDGRGDVSGLAGDFGLHAVDAARFALLVAGADTGIRVGITSAVDALVHAAHAFLDLRDGQWRASELDSPATAISARLPYHPGDESLIVPPPSARPPIGWFDHDTDGRVCLGGGVQFGVLPARTAEFLAAVGTPLVVTPWRSLLVTDLDEWTAEQVVRVLAPMGLVFDENSPVLDVTACAGSPACSKSHADVRADARTALESGTLPVAGRQHWAGCERKCGRPAAAAADVVATPNGYRLDTAR
ncbi:precorrin-3B synthase [Rhodococcus sp. HNM0569]|uniref:precorrin-3B synthase n=1 Tax=Rhodococcus sp. HNM0569 TaxID=2716340 RepID=UPI00146CA13F|nr:precorrin-3B synthase [Rhodococcus sp. HNM0569]NLU84945.1 precorrin-3B synthase [Rhodococcus sp. HNM0569]